MTDSEAALRIDALLPREIARRAEDVGVQKAAIDPWTLLALAVLAGAFIALGGVFSTVALSGSSGMPWGAARVLAGVVFSLGLVLVVIAGAELFTGNVLLVMAWASGRVRASAVLRAWALAYLGNFAGAIATAAFVYLARSHTMGDGVFGATAIGIAAGKLKLGFVEAVARGTLCNALVCLAVWLSLGARTTTDKVYAVVFPISAFVAAGFEHSIANMYFVPLALFVARGDPSFVAAHGLQPAADALSWSGFLVRNLLPVTIGNMIGGAVLVGAVYWFVYLRRPKHGASPASQTRREPAG